MPSYVLSPAERRARAEAEAEALLQDNLNAARAATRGRTETPEQASRTKRAARDLSVPYRAAQILGDEVVSAVRARKVEEAVRTVPSLAKPLSDVYLSTIADGDEKEMVRTAKAAQARPDKRTYPVLDGFKALFGMDGGDSVRVRTPAEQAAFEAEQAKLGKTFVQGTREIGIGLTSNIADLYAKAFEAIGIDPTAAQSIGMLTRLRATEEIKKGDALMPAEGGPIKKGVFSGVRSLPGSLAGLGVAAVAGPLAGATFIGANTQGRSYVEGRNQGLDVGEATRYAATDTAIEIATEYVPFARLLNDTPVGSTLGKRLLRNLVDEQIGEQAATALQDLNAWATLPENADKTFNDYLADRPDAAIQTAIATLVSTGATNTVVAAIDKVAKKVAKARTGEEDAVTLDTIMDSATKHKMRERDPEAFAEYVDSQTQGTGAENVYLPVEALDTLFQSENVDEDVQAFFEQYQDQIEEARVTGGDVVIPTSAIAARLAGTPAWEALKPDARLDAGGFSPRELETEVKDAEKILEQRGEEIANAALDEITANAPAVAVFEDVKAQLVAAGFTDATATKQASVYAANREAWGKRLGMTALEYHQQNPVSFERAGITPDAPDATRVMDQPSAPLRLTGLPQKSLGGFAPAHSATETYRATRSDLPPAPKVYTKVDPARAARIAQAYEEMPNAPNDPEVRRAYGALVEETLAQWQTIKATGLKVEFAPEQDPYAGNPMAAVRDVRDNNHIYVFSTEEGYGQEGISDAERAQNPMLAKVKGEKWSGKPVLVNDVFRLVHDYFGHIKEGVGFRADGEENAWRIHSSMFSPEARRALTTETRGQNSWLNFGPNGEANRTAAVEDTVFAEQKIGLLPDWVVNEGLADDPAALYQASRYDERFGDQPLTVADRFGDPASLLNHDDWAVLTAENPRGEQADDITNARAMRDLEADLQAMGLVYTRAIGKYGQVENSFAVVGITQAEAEMLGRKYDQDSVLTSVGFTYQDGSVNPVTGSVDIYEDRPEDFFTEIPELGVQFAVGIDFDNKINPDTGIAGWTPQRVDKLIESADQSSDKRYVVMMSPDEFLGLTLSEKGREVVSGIVDGFGPLDPAQLEAGGPQTLVLNIGGEPSDYQKKTSGMTRLPSYTMGHDGRHRATLLKKAGVTKMPVVLNIRQGELPQGEPVLIGGNRTREALSQGDTPYTLVAPVQITAENRDAINAMWTPATILFQSENPIFYSALARAIDSSKQTKAPASQWKGVLQNAPGVKAEELEWSGLLEMLDFDPNAVLTKEQLADAVAAGGIKIEERMLGENTVSDDEVERRVDEKVQELEDEFFEGYEGGSHFISEDENDGEEGTTPVWRVYGPSAEASDFYDTEDEAQTVADEYNASEEEYQFDYWRRENINRDRIERATRERMEEDDENATQFSEWNSDSRNDTYRELLLTLPIGEGGNPERAPSTHWDQPAVVAHVRFMGKEDVDGNRVLFVEEVQSDWHQKGRDQGYEREIDPQSIEMAKVKLQEAVKAEDAAREAFWPLAQRAWDENSSTARMLSDRVRGTVEGFAEAKEALRQAAEAARLADVELRVAQGVGNNGVPNAPFKTSWPALVMKRVIKYAVDGGYDKVAWTTGEQQADRYSLAESTGPLTFSEEGGRYLVKMNARAAEMLVQNNLGGYSGNLGVLLMTEDQMKEAFGNDITKRAVDGVASDSAGVYTLEGEDLKIGGEGMKAFYDRNLVNITNGLVKKAGAKVGPVVLELSDEDMTVDEVNRIAEIDAEMRDMQGAAADRYRAAKPTGLSFDEEQRFRREYGVSDAEREAQAQFAALKAEKETIRRNSRKRGKAQPGFEITDALREQASAGFPLFQKTGKPRGQIAMYTDRMVITLFEDADLSTLLHETGHLFVEELARNAQRPNAPADVKADWAAMRKWLKQNGHTVKGVNIPREAHELMARGFERYLMEGRAPSKNLEGVFGTFRAWLVRIYQNVQRLASPITPEVREVFDRLLATQEAIDAYREEQNARPLFADKPADMTQAEFDAYRESVLASRDEAQARLTKKIMEDIRKRENKRYRDRAKDVRDDVIEELNTDPRFVALHLLRTGRWLGDGEREQFPVKIDRDWFVSTYGATALDRLPKGPFLVKKDGDEADFIAEMVGFPSGAAMIDALFEMGDAQVAMRAEGDRRQLIDKETDERVKAILEADGTADALTAGTIEEEAQAAVENEQQGALLSTELRYLSRGTNQTPTPYRMARVWAERKIRAGTVQAVASRAAVQQYARAAAKSGRLAEEALIAGDQQEAYRQKQAQLINHALFMEAKLAADKVDTIVARMRRLGKRAAMKSVDQDYMDRVHGLLEGFDFRKKSRKFLEEQQGFAEWAAAQSALGFEVQVPPRLMLNGTPYARASVEELYGLDDAVKALLHLGKLKQGIKDGQAEREFNSLIDEMVDYINRLPDRKLSTEINEDDRPAASVLSFLIKIETIADDLDGGDPNGPFNRLLTQRANDMENIRSGLRDRTLNPISQAYLNMPAAQRKRLEEKITIPQFRHKGGELDPRNGGPTTMTRMELLSIALNTGNLSNLEKMATGEGWSIPDIRAVLDKELTKEDWDFVQSVWDSLASLWPEIAATERALSGVVPEQVEITPVQTKFGEYRGGYYPVVYDPARSQRAENNALNEANDLFGMKSGINTPKGHTITRTEATGPILRSVEAVLFTHIEKVITRIAYAEYARDVLRTMDNPRVRNAIDLKLGREYRKQIRPWLQRVVNAASIDQRGLNWAERFLRSARVNMSLVAMGFRVSTAMAQVGGLNQAAGRIGPRYVALGMKTLLRDRGKAVQFVFDRSPEMERRNGEVNRDVADAMKMMRGKNGIVNKARVMAFWHIGMMDRYAVAVPTWLGAHAKAIDDGMTDREASYYADKMVRTSQGNGAEKDLANWQSPNSEAMRSLTLFYTIFNVQLNAQWESVRAVKKGNYMKAAVLTGWFLMMAPLVDALLSNDIPDPDDEDDTWANWFFRNVFFNLFSGIPLVRDVSGYAERKMAGQYATAGTSPVLRAEDAAIKAGGLAVKAAKGEELPDNTVKIMIETPGYFLGLPTGQPAATGQFLWDYTNGDTNPEGFTDWYFGLVKGKVPEEK